MTMPSTSYDQSGVTYTERGLVIAGTRITLYQLMDYLHAGHSPQAFRRHFPQIADHQFEAAISYIAENWAEVEAEYQMVVKQDEELRQVYEAQNRERLAHIAQLPPPLGLETAWEKLQAAKAKLASRA
jgi:uncharacterized protein (DUF433 family)